MKKFSYFLYENFDADKKSENPLNPRTVINSSVDAILSYVADFPPLNCIAARLEDKFGAEIVEKLVKAGVLRRGDGLIAFDTPIFLSEDVSALKSFFASAAVHIAEKMWGLRDKLWKIVGGIDNGFEPPQNLYHVLCGMIFDGLFFDWLVSRGDVTVSRLHASGLDYLSVIYEDCQELKQFSDGLLCSYNRLTDGKVALQSFGDADGNRFDLYRCFRLREAGQMFGRFRHAGELLDRLPKGKERQLILDAAFSLLNDGECSEDCLALLELFGYTKGGKICVPVFSHADEPTIMRVATIAEENIYSDVAHVLRDAKAKLKITAIRHGVPFGEISNELYHILFGSINEELVKCGLTARPLYTAGEGRYLKCIEW